MSINDINLSRVAQIESVYQGLVGIAMSPAAALECYKSYSCPNEDGIDTLYYKDYRTLGFKIPRQCGKTTWIHEKTKSSDGVLMVVKDDKFSKIAKEKGVPPSRVIPINKFTTESLYGVDIILVDEGCFTAKGVKENEWFYREIAGVNNPNIQIVLIG